MKDRKNHQNILEKAVALQQDLEETRHIDTGKAYHKTMAKIRKEERRQKWVLPFQRIASILLLPFVLSTFFLTYLHYNKEIKSSPLLYTEITAAPGTIIETTLPDESVVWLNAGSKLSYPQQFVDAVRPVRLSGEAFFQVKTNPSQPFEVHLSSDLKVIARGTSFNISAYEDDLYQEIVLEEGIVEIKGSEKNYLMRPGEMALWDKNQKDFTVSPVSTYEKTAWKEGYLIFRNTPMQEVVRKLSRRYNVTIRLLDSDRDYNNIRATFSTESVYQILDYLKVITPIEWSVKDVRQNQDSTFPRQEIEVWQK